MGVSASGLISAGCGAGTREIGFVARRALVAKAEFSILPGRSLGELSAQVLARLCEWFIGAIRSLSCKCALSDAV
jgi:hypothetical protein